MPMTSPSSASSSPNPSGSLPAHRDDGKRFIVRADEKLTAFVELERQVLTVTFYLALFKPIRAGTTNDTNWTKRSRSSGGRSRAACLAALRIPIATAAARRPGQSTSFMVLEVPLFFSVWPLIGSIMFKRTDKMDWRKCNP